MATNQHQSGAFLHNYRNEAFDLAIRSGISFFLDGDWPNTPPTAQQIVEFVKDNIIDNYGEGWFTDERLADMLGFLVGWILGEYIVAHPVEEANGVLAQQ